jgi:serine/threonine protein kinase
MALSIKRPTNVGKAILSYTKMKQRLIDAETFAPEKTILDDDRRSVFIYKQGGVTYVMKLGNHASLGEATKYRLLQNEDNMYKKLLQLGDNYSKYFPAIIDSGDEKDFYYIIMEYIEGITLSDYINEYFRKPPPINDVLTILVNLTEALAAMYSTGIVHGDLSAENVMITPDGSVKLIDFEKGSIKNNVSLNIFGSPEKFDYTPPEYKLNTINSNIEIIKKENHGLGYLFIMIKLLLPFEREAKGLIMQILETILECDEKCRNVYTECLKVLQEYTGRITGTGAGGAGNLNNNTSRRNVTSPFNPGPTTPSSSLDPMENSEPMRNTRRRKLRKRKTRKL